MPVPVVQQSDITATSKLVYAVILDLSQGGTARAGARWIAARIGTSRAAVQRAIKTLTECNLIQIESKTQGRRPVYRVPQLVSKRVKYEEPNLTRNEATKCIETSPVKVSKRVHPSNQTTNQTTNQKKSTCAQRELFAAIITVFGLPAETPTQKSRIGKVAKDLAAMKATPADVKVRVDRYRRAWPNMACTPEAVTKHWSEFKDEKKPTTENRLGRVQAVPGKYAVERTA